MRRASPSRAPPAGRGADVEVTADGATSLLEAIRASGVETAHITLHVGAGTFQPVRVEKVEDHKLHREWYEIPAEAARLINVAKEDKRRVVAVERD